MRMYRSPPREQGAPTHHRTGAGRFPEGRPPSAIPPVFRCTPAARPIHCFQNRPKSRIGGRSPGGGCMGSNHFKLSVMMFLNIFVWGAWFPIISLYLQGLGFNPEWQQPLIVNMFHLAAITAMFFSTQFADR